MGSFKGSFFMDCFKGSFKGSFKGIRIESYFIATLIDASNIVASVTLIATLVRMSSWKPLCETLFNRNSGSNQYSKPNPSSNGVLGIETNHATLTWDFPKIRVPFLGGPYNRGPTIKGTILGSPIFGNPHIRGTLLFYYLYRLQAATAPELIRD